MRLLILVFLLAGCQADTGQFELTEDPFVFPACEDAKAIDPEEEC